MIRVEISCNRCNVQLGSCTDSVSGESALRRAKENCNGKYEVQQNGGVYCLRCVAICKWLATPADKRGPAPADPCARNDR